MVSTWSSISPTTNVENTTWFGPYRYPYLYKWTFVNTEWRLGSWGSWWYVETTLVGRVPFMWKPLTKTHHFDGYGHGSKEHIPFRWVVRGREPWQHTYGIRANIQPGAVSQAAPGYQAVTGSQSWPNQYMLTGLCLNNQLQAL